MQLSYPLVISNEVSAYECADSGLNESHFVLSGSTQLHFSDANDHVLSGIIYTIIKQPTNLLAHIQRITFCYEHSKDEQLSAALIDLFVILENVGATLKTRMLSGVAKHLPSAVVKQLQSYLNDYRLIQGNEYSVLTAGIESNELLVLVQANENEAKPDLTHDPLQIARDYIEYSQLDEAIQVLEEAIIKTPERSELHNDLLELYQSTDNSEAFKNMQRILASINHPMQPQWDALNFYFKL